jgi:ribosome assembly protein YihI (activator of Der GTPase)
MPEEKEAAAEQESLEALIEPEADATSGTTDPADTTPSGEAADQTAEETPKEQPGTPDKALQKVQQDLATLTRLMERQQSGQTLTANEQKVVNEAPRKLDAIRKAIGEKKFDVFEHGNEVGDALVEVASDTDLLKKAVGAIGQQLVELQQET